MIINPFILDQATPWTNTLSTTFDGVDDYVTMDGAASIFSSSYSVSFWFNGTTFPIGGPGGRVLFALHTSAGGNLLFVVADPQGILHTFNNSSIRAQGTTQTSTGTWNHCAITTDGTNMKLYKNGTLEDTSATGNYNTGTVGLVSLAQEWDGATPSDFYNGKLDEVAFFNSEISASDITTIYNSGVPTDLTSLSPSSWYRMGDGDTFPTITDNAGSNNATMVNMTSGDFVADVP